MLAMESTLQKSLFSIEFKDPGPCRQETTVEKILITLKVSSYSFLLSLWVVYDIYVCMYVHAHVHTQTLEEDTRCLPLSVLFPWDRVSQSASPGDPPVSTAHGSIPNYLRGYRRFKLRFSCLHSVKSKAAPQNGSAGVKVLNWALAG